MVAFAFVKRLIGDRRGTSAMEYALICALIVLAMISGLNALGNMTRQTWGTVSTQTAAAVSQATAS